MPHEPALIRPEAPDGTASLCERIRRRQDVVILSSLFLSSFLLHAVTAARTVTFSDSGDFLMAVASVGNCHGPGYPLFLMSAKLFSWIVPIGSLAFRVSLMSGLFASLTACLIYWIVFRMVRNRIGGLVAGLAFAFSFTFWYQTVIPETYAMGAFLIALIIVIMLRWERLVHQGNKKSANNTLALLAFVFGLSMTSGFTILFVLPALIFFGLDTDYKQFLAPRNLLRMGAFFVLGLLPFIYEPVAAFRGPVYNYGDPSTLIRWFHHVTLYYQRGGLFGYPLQLYGGRIGRYFGSLTTEFPYFFWLAAVGFVALFLRRRKYGFFLTLLFLFTLFAAVSYNQIESVLRAHFYYPSYFVIALLIGFGAAWIAGVVKKWATSKDRLVAVVAVSLVAVLLVVWACTAIPVHYSKVDKSHYDYARVMALGMIDKARPAGIILTDTDNVVFPCKYLSWIQGIGPDTRAINPRSLTVPGWPGEDLNVTLPPPGVEILATDDPATSLAKRNASTVPFLSSGISFGWFGWNIQWEGTVNHLYLDKAIHPAGKPTIVKQGSTALADLDSDAREAIVLSDIMKAYTYVYAGDLKKADLLYQRITDFGVSSLYVATLYGAETISATFELWGQTLNNQGNYRKTVQVMPRARIVDPDFTSMTYAHALTKVGQLDAALNEIDNFLLHYPSTPAAYVERGEIYILQGDYTAASSALKTAVELTPNDPRSHYDYGVALLRDNNKKAATEQFKLAIAKSPYSEWADKAQQMLNTFSTGSTP